MRDFESCLLRLTNEERQQLLLVVAALKVSEYTDEVDDWRFRQRSNQEGRMISSMQNFFDTTIGLAIASDAVPKSVRDQLAKRADISSYAPVLAQLFEVVRRHKQLNPTAHQCEFGKLMMVLQDAQKPSVQRALGLNISLVIPLQTVGAALHEIGSRDALLEDPELERFIAIEGELRTRSMEMLLERYDTNQSPAERAVLERCLRSIADVESQIMNSVESLLALQKALLDVEQSGDISIRSGKGGSMLSHGHKEHCMYVRESLVLWELVQRNIFRLWTAAEKDMLIEGGGRYQFVNTGQGFQRMCSSPHSHQIMSWCVKEAERRMNGKWVGIKVIHVGDRDVPNPLVFIDKYTQVPNLVHPISQTLKELRVLFGLPSTSPTVAANPIAYPGISNLLSFKYSNYEKLRLMILTDFFKHGFDGSGDDGGNCIDGRLTSAWNWCQQVSKKPYYEAFLLTGFLGFG